MKRFSPVAIVIIVSTLCIGLLFLWKLSTIPSSQEAKVTPNMEVKPSIDITETMEPFKDDEMGTQEDTDARYIAYSNTNFVQAIDKRRVLFFYASWCPTCRPADTDFTNNMSQIPEDVVVLRVNYNDPDTDQDEKDLAEQYGITYQHTYVQIDASGQIVKKWNGGKLNELLINIQ